MKRNWFFIVLLFGIFIGCKKQEAPEVVPSGEYCVYYLQQKDNVLVGEHFSPKSREGVELIEELLKQLRMPSEAEHLSAMDASVHMPEITMQSNGLVTLLFDGSYAGVSGVNEVLMRAAIVKTLCQSKQVDTVEFYVSGQPLMNSQNTPIGIMKAEDFLESTGPDASSMLSVQTILYYTDQSGRVLLASSVTLAYNSNESEELAVLRQLIAGPTEQGMYPVLPETVEIHSVSTKDGVCTVDFDSHFLEKTGEISEEVLIYSVVNSLVNLPGVQKVQFLIDGQVHKLFQKMDLSLCYERNLNIVENE